MKNYKLILCLLVVIIASISCAAASDVNTSTDNNIYTSTVTDDVAVSEPNEVKTFNNLERDNGADTQTTSGYASIYQDSEEEGEEDETPEEISTNFTNLQGILDNSTNNDNITLNNTTWSSNTSAEEGESGLNITNKNLTIYGGNNNTTNDGNYSILDGNGSNNVTLIINGTSNVTLYNIIFQNAQNTAVQINVTSAGSVTFINCIFRNNSVNASNAGAVYINGTSKATFINSTFLNNTADEAGAVFLNEKANATFINSTFIRNSANATGNGGAVYVSHNATANFTGSRFINNRAVRGGAVIVRSNATGYFDECLFIRNNATGGNGGGALKLGTNSTTVVNNSRFINNTAATYGGAIYVDNATDGHGSLLVNNSVFEANSANTGGAIYLYPNSTANIIGSNFTGNNAAVYGGAIYLNTTNASISESNFDYNNAKISGGAVYVAENISTNINDSNFTFNKAIFGGALYNHGYINLTNASIMNNTATNGGGLYLSRNGKANITSSNFTDNEAKQGIAIYSAGSLNLTDVNTDVKYGEIFNTGESQIETPVELNITANPDVTYWNSVEITAALNQTGLNLGTLIFQITNNVTEEEDLVPVDPNENGTYSFTYYLPVFSANYTVSVLDDQIESSFTNLTIGTANFTSIGGFTLSVDATNTTNGGDSKVDVSFKNGEQLFNGTLTVYLDGEEYGNVTLENGEGSLTLSNLTLGKHDVTVMYGDNKNNVADNTTFYVKENITLSDSSITVKDNGDNTTTVILEFPHIASGNITVTINGTEYNATLNNGVAVISDVNGTFTDLIDITVNYPGNDLTFPFTERLNLDLRDIELTAEGSSIVSGDNGFVTVGLTINGVPATENVTVTINGDNFEKTFNAEVVNGSSMVDLGDLAPGIYNVTVKYSNKVATTTVYVKNNITKEDVTIEASKNANGTTDLTVTVPEGVNGNITFTVGGKNYTAEIINGTATVTTDQPYDEAFNVTVSYAGDDVSYPFEYTYTFGTSEITVTVENVTMYYKNGSGVVVNVGMGNTPIANQTVYITINGNTYNRTTDENGTAQLPLGLNPGEYNVTTKYVGTDGQNYTVESTVTILSTVSGDNIVKYFRNATRYYANFLDAQGKPLANTDVTFNINGVFYNATTDENGTASLAINLLPNEYIITAYNPINNQSFSNNVTVLNTVNTTNIVKYFRNGTQFSAKVIDGTGNAVAGSTVTFNINGVFYNRTTDADGVATLNINLNPGDYTLTTYNTLTGQSVGNSVKVLPVLTGNDLSKLYGQAGAYVAHLVDSQGNPYANQEVTFNINGKMYHKFTDANGDARLSINLLPGRYVITAYAGSASNSNTITVAA